MNISTDTINRAIEANAPDASAMLKVQIKLLKKSLQAQQDQAAELMKMTEGKGHILDVRA